MKATRALARWETVDDPDELGSLLGAILGLPALPANDADLAAMRPLRAALTRIAYGSAEAGAPPSPIDPPRPGDIDEVNAAAALPPLVPELRPDGSDAIVAPSAAAALSTVARDAVDLFGSPLARRVRVCAADNCGLLLLDTSRSGRCRWCSMEVCGNRSKVRAHRYRE